MQLRTAQEPVQKHPKKWISLEIRKKRRSRNCPVAEFGRLPQWLADGAAEGDGV
jgi:hypothetical protein